MQLDIADIDDFDDDYLALALRYLRFRSAL